MKILIAEDEAISRRLLQARLTEWGYEVIACSDGIQAREALQAEDPPPLVILDWMMPGMSGLQICRELRKQSTSPYVYVLLLTSKNQKAEIMEGMEAGADDYLTKPFEADELRAALRTGKRILDLQAKLLDAQKVLQFEATHDALTGLWNRAQILGMLDRELPRAQREQKPLGVVMVDLDHFKSINDIHGHLAGDSVLRAAARKLGEAIRPYDGVARYGGEEFLVILPGCDLSAAGKVAERLRTAVSEAPINIGQGQMFVTCSLGVACTSLMAAPSPNELVRAADMALYRSKAEGRNRVSVAAPESRGNTKQECLPQSLPLLSVPAAGSMDF